MSFSASATGASEANLIPSGMSVARHSFSISSDDSVASTAYSMLRPSGLGYGPKVLSPRCS